MSTTKRKHATSPPSSSKKRKHRHSTPSSAVAEPASRKPTSSPPQLFQKARLKIHVAVPPAAMTSLNAYIHTYLTSSLLLKHTPNGTIVAFSGFKGLAGTGRIRDECPFSWAWFEGDIVVFNPRVGQRMRTHFMGLAECRGCCDVEFTRSCCVDYPCFIQCVDSADADA